LGGGGGGCELLKDLALSGFRDVHVIDADTIDVTNLNRQFLFRMGDVGKAKADVAAAAVMARVPGVVVTAHKAYIQDKEPDFYRQFRVIIGGLDNLAARRWINSLLCSFVDTDAAGNPVDASQIIPFVDGGTEGFAGQARVILPRITCCFECTLDMFPPQTSYAMCTLAETPRQPEHCVAYAMVKLWDEKFPDRKLNTDSPDDMRWVYERAAERAATYGIEGVTYTLTMGVVKNIIPAIASTNALIAAQCVAETLKLVTFASQTMNNYWLCLGREGVASDTHTLERKEDCTVCHAHTLTRTVPSTTTLGKFLEGLEVDPVLELVKPAAALPDRALYVPKPEPLRVALAPNLEKALADLMPSGTAVCITTPAMVNALIVRVIYA